MVSAALAPLVKRPNRLNLADDLFTALLVVLFFMLAQPHQASAPPRPPAVTCQEDDPCWNCSTMGNKVCGPNVQEGDK